MFDIVLSIVIIASDDWLYLKIIIIMTGLAVGAI